MHKEIVSSGTEPMAHTVNGEKSADKTATPDQHSGVSVQNVEESEEEHHEYITGLKLGVVMVSVTLVVFLMMLDLAIIATVSRNRVTIWYDQLPLLIPVRPFLV